MLSPLQFFALRWPLGITLLLCLSTHFAQASNLNEVYQLALQNDTTLNAAQAQFRADSEAKAQARAALLPQLGASIEKSDTESDSLGFSQYTPNDLSPTATEINSDSRIWSANLQQTLFDLSAWFSFKQGVSISKQAEWQFAVEQQNLIVRVTEAYLNVLRDVDNLNSSKAEEAAIKRQLEQTQQRYEVGLIAITDVHESQAAYDLAVVKRLTDQGNLGAAYEALTVITGEKHESLWPLKSDFPAVVPQPQNRDEWVDIALKNNLQLKAAELGVDAARHSARAAKAAHLPTLSGNFSYSDVDEDTITSSVPVPVGSEGTTETLSIRLQAPLFTGGATSSRRKQAEQLAVVAHENAINVQRRIVQNTRSQHLAATLGAAYVKARKLAIKSAQSALDATKAGYDAGTRNIVDLLDAQRVLFAAQRDYASSRYDYILNMMQLKLWAGSLNPQDIFDLNQWLDQAAATSTIVPRDRGQ